MSNTAFPSFPLPLPVLRVFMLVAFRVLCRAAATADSAPLGLLTDIFLRGAVNAPEEARGDCCTTLRFQGKPDVFLEAESNEERTAWMTELRLVLASRKPIVGPDETNEIESSVAAMRALANAFVPSRASDSKAHPTSHAAPALAKVAAPDDDDHALAFLVEWMRSAGLSSSATLASYAARLILRGFDVPAALAHLTAADLEAMGIHKIGHQRLLLAAAQPEGRAAGTWFSRPLLCGEKNETADCFFFAGAGSQGVVEPSAPPAELETHVDVPMFHADDSAIPNTTSEGTVAAMPCAAGAPAIPLCVTD